ncbi:hypothetical protein D9M69_489490 [compost metagenome]
MGHQSHVAAAQGGAQEGVGGGAAHAVAGIDVVAAHAFRVRAVEVRGKGQAEFFGGSEEVTAQRVQFRADIGDVQRTA